MKRLNWAAAVSAALLMLACGKSEASEVLRFSGIPDAHTETLQRQYEAVTRYLSNELGIPVEYVYVPDYTAAVTSLAANKLDLVWLGGVTAVQAEERTGGEVTFIASRDTDLGFKTYFIANRALVDAGKLRAAETLNPMPIERLAALKPSFAELTFTFGSKSSTSGHLMPRHFLSGAGIDPETDFKGRAGFQLQGGHSATLSQVTSGAYDLGALNYTTWETADADTRDRAPVVYVTPDYVDYCMVAHNRIGAALIAKLRASFANLDGSNSDQRAVLEAFGAERFVPADPKRWDDIRAVLREATDKGVLQ